MPPAWRGSQTKHNRTRNGDDEMKERALLFIEADGEGVPVLIYFHHGSRQIRTNLFGEG
jgi:hypothetical protein